MGKKAFVTLLYGNQPFFVEALVLAKSLQPLKDRADIILMLGEGVSGKRCSEKTQTIHPYSTCPYNGHT